MKKINQMQSIPLSIPLLLASSLALVACEGIPIGNVDNNHDETLIINNHKKECRLYNAANSSLCIQAKIKGDDNWFLLEENSLNGFNYAWGYDYEIEVNIEELVNPPEDAPNKKYTYKKEIQKSTASTINNNFEISVSTGIIKDHIKKVSSKENTYTLFDDKEITCLATVCFELDTLISTDKAVLLELKHQSPASEPLDLIKIKCNAPKDTFLKDCLEQ